MVVDRPVTVGVVRSRVLVDSPGPDSGLVLKYKYEVDIYLLSTSNK